ncbi:MULTISPECIES: hypothetical protein [unclassified Pseudomonas]|uniref:hypothetical protein n=1 Tax=unclassified Pseudomonas TaxID=196821 RepID=UPI001EFCCDD5|nr:MULTISPECIES: hypothetical protein [unclassified Pseudomonas]
MLSFYTALNPQDRPLSCAVQIAAAFHDLGIWTHGTLDYLAPSRMLARASARQLLRTPLRPLPMFRW